MKKFLIILTALIIVVVAGLYLGIDVIVKRAIEEGTGYATGVPTSVRRVDVGLASGQMDIGRLEVGNPPGYESPYFLQLNALSLAVKPRTLLNPTIHVPTFTVEGAQVNVERAGRTSNLSAILENLQRFGDEPGEGGQPPANGEPGPQTRFIIDRLRINDVTARALLAQELGKDAAVEVSVPPITLQNIGADSGGVTVGQLAALITRELLTAVSRELELPADLEQQLQRHLEQVQDLEGTARKEVEERAREELERNKKELLEKGRELLEPK